MPGWWLLSHLSIRRTTHRPGPALLPAGYFRVESTAGLA
jgi:hypothetical protein